MWVTLWPLLIGIGIVIGFTLARIYYMRRKAQEPPVPAEPQPRAGAWQTREEETGRARIPADHGPGHQDGPPPTEYENVTREPEEVEPGPRLTPEHLRTYPGPRTD